MGDLKKKKPVDDNIVDYVVELGDGKEVIIEHGNASGDEQVMERLRGYIQKFYEMQEEKVEQEELKRKEDE